MTTIIQMNSTIHRFLSRSLILRSSNLFRQQNHWICLNRMINSQSRTIKNQSLQFSLTHLDVIAIDLENISHWLHFWASYSMRLSITLSLSSRYWLSFLSSIRSYISHFFNSSHSDKKRSTNSSKKMFFQSIDKNDVSTNVCIFNSRFVNKIKHLEIDITFEKSQLVVQTFNDQNKNLKLTQSFIIQRVNQRLILRLIVIFSEMNLYLKNITQTYVQSIASLNRDFFVRSFVELIKHLDIDSDNIFKKIKSLYDILEANNHWFVIYHVYHVNKLKMTQSIYDFCFLHTNMKLDTSTVLQIDLKEDSLHTNMSIVNMQTNDILILINSKFAAAEEKAIIDAKIMIKSRDDLDSNSSLKFNDTIIQRQENSVYFNQFSQFDHLQLIKTIDFTITSSRSNEYTISTIRLTSWSRAKHSRFWKSWSTLTRSIWTSSNELNVR